MIEKKKYEAPKMKSYQVKPANIICTSPNSAKENEEYEEESTSGWF